ncbi:MAG: DUF5652 family protein [Minisyncoccia bacterium]
MINIIEFVKLHPIIFLIVLSWLIVWKGLALWISAKRNNAFWFVIFLVVNTLSIGEIIYYIYIKISEKREKTEIK